MITSAALSAAEAQFRQRRNEVGVPQRSQIIRNLLLATQYRMHTSVECTRRALVDPARRGGEVVQRAGLFEDQCDTVDPSRSDARRSWLRFKHGLRMVSTEAWFASKGRRGVSSL